MLCRSAQGSMHVDHIKPRSKYPHLELEFSNIQVLCPPCNFGKSNKYEDDFRSA
ncbi:MAG: HNH endonuclease [Proteobacteria bacterium]|nr:MAG: HNH endonuclease [Pseudomonadota bacterium]